MKDDKLYLIHIDECIEPIESYVKGIDKEAFLASSLVQDAVVRNLQVMAESTQRLSDSLKDSHPEIEWFRMAGFRNVLVHDYLGVDVERIWTIVEKELPTLKQAVRKMLD
ncbi:MAG: DUF86 domain-containing protein [Sedimentisphaerales bacterium]|nr:DUF86 domain-containing protein [Sedimentisphaerales bacterium]